MDFFRPKWFRFSINTGTVGSGYALLPIWGKIILAEILHPSNGLAGVVFAAFVPLFGGLAEFANRLTVIVAPLL